MSFRWCWLVRWFLWKERNWNGKMWRENGELETGTCRVPWIFTCSYETFGEGLRHFTAADKSNLERHFIWRRSVVNESNWFIQPSKIKRDSRAVNEVHRCHWTINVKCRATKCSAFASMPPRDVFPSLWSLPRCLTSFRSRLTRLSYLLSNILSISAIY